MFSSRVRTAHSMADPSKVLSSSLPSFPSGSLAFFDAFPSPLHLMFKRLRSHVIALRKAGKIDHAGYGVSQGHWRELGRLGGDPSVILARQHQVVLI